MKEGYSMRKKITGFLVGTLMLTLVAGTAAFASENNGGASAKTAEKEKQAIEMEDAAKIALEDAKVTEADAVIYKRIWEYSDNAEIFEIDFLIPGQVKYEYESEDTERVIGIAADMFVEAILKDAISGVIQYVPKR